MSTAIRHAMTWGKDEDGSIYVIPVQQADGNWIRHAEYAKLEAEVEKLRSQFANSEQDNARLKAEVENFKEYLKWHADGHKFNAWEIWRRQQSDAGEGKPSV